MKIGGSKSGIVFGMYVSYPGGKVSEKLGGGVSREVVREVPVKLYLARETNFTETSLTTSRQTSRLTSREVLEDVSATLFGNETSVTSNTRPHKFET